MLNFHLLFVIVLLLIFFISFTSSSRQAFFAQQISQCSIEEYFNVNLLKCVKCEQIFDHQKDQDLFAYLYPIPNQAFSSNLVLRNQNFSHLAAGSSSSRSQIQSNFERSVDGLSCVCKKGNFAFNKNYVKNIDLNLPNEIICLPCPKGMTSSLNQNTCSFCEKIPKHYLNNQQTLEISNLDLEQETDCGECGQNEISVDYLIDSNELANLNKTALLSNYIFSFEFNLTHLDQLLVQKCVKCPTQTKPINNQCKACHFSFKNCDCSQEFVINEGVCVAKKQILNYNPELFKINFTIDEQPKEQTSPSNEQAEILKETVGLKFSPFIANNFHSSFSQCFYYHNITACQQLANLCVLNHYRFNQQNSFDQTNSGERFKLTAELKTVCDVFISMNRGMPVNYLPQIYFRNAFKDEGTKKFLFETNLLKTNLPIKFKLNERLRFYMATFNANGVFKESKELYLDELLICSSKDESMEPIVRFGVNVEFSCHFQLTRLFKYTSTNSENQLFYELYLLLNQTSFKNQTTSKVIRPERLIYPIYILNRNLLKEGQLVNKDGYTLDWFNYYMDHSNYFTETINRWQLTKRFFISEQITSKVNSKRRGNGSGNLAAVFNEEGLYGNGQPILNEKHTINDHSEYGEILRYINNIKLIIRINPDHPDQIYPPLLILDYSQVTKQQLEKQPKQTVKIELNVQFESNELSLYKKLTVFLAVFCSLAVVLAFFRTWAWSKRITSKNNNELKIILLKFILFNFDYLANVFFILVLIISINSFLIYKFQSVAFCFLPSKSLEHYIQLYIILAFSFKSISILHEFYIRSDIDIFFIDWEKSRSNNFCSLNGSSNVSKLNNGTGANNLNNFSNQQNNGVQETDNHHLYRYLNHHNLNGNRSTADNRENLQEKLMQNQKLDDSELNKSQSQLVNQFNKNSKFIDQYPDVSIWRTLFVANEYCELCTYRRVSISHHLFILLIVLHCWGIENFAKADLELNFSLKENQKYVANSFTSRFVVGSLTFLITVLVNLFFTRYYFEPFIQDKISEFVDFCSVSNVSIFCLMYEKFGYYVHGRNPTGRSEVNMPEMHHNLLTEEEDLCSKRGLLPNSDVQCFQMFLNDKLVMNYKKIRALLKHKTQMGLRVALHKAQNVQKIWYSYYLMNKLLSGFIDHMFVEMDYIVKERTLFEMLLDAELTDVQILDKSIFFPDKNHSFENVLFVGVELDVIFYELMLFILIDLLTFNYIVAISFTFILNEVLERYFQKMIKKNLIRKALVDQRFLL